MPLAKIIFPLALTLSACNETQSYSATTLSGTVEEATISSVEVFTMQRERGLRSVRVKLRPAGASQDIYVEEWVPTVLLGRLTVGATVHLINDPLEAGRKTLGL